MRSEESPFEEAMHHLRKCTSEYDLETIAKVAIRKWMLEKTKNYLDRNHIRLEDEENIEEVACDAAENLTCYFELQMSDDIDRYIQTSVEQCGQILDDEKEDF